MPEVSGVLFGRPCQFNYPQNETANTRKVRGGGGFSRFFFLVLPLFFLLRVQGVRFFYPMRPDTMVLDGLDFSVGAVARRRAVARGAPRFGKR